MNPPTCPRKPFPITPPPKTRSVRVWSAMLLAIAVLAGAAIPTAAADTRANPPDELLRNGDFSQGQAHWESEQANGATAQIDIVKDGPTGRPALWIKVLTIADKSWRLQWSQKQFTITKGRPYVLTFWARAKNAGAINVTCMQNHAPWDHSTQAKIELTSEWRQIEFPFTGAWDDDNARISFTNLGTDVGQEYWFARCSLQPH
jgi:hypothetical protein